MEIVHCPYLFYISKKEIKLSLVKTKLPCYSSTLNFFLLFTEAFLHDANICIIVYTLSNLLLYKLCTDRVEHFHHVHQIIVWWFLFSTNTANGKIPHCSLFQKQHHLLVSVSPLFCQSFYKSKDCCLFYSLCHHF